jgi:hypothetical protein
MAISIEQYILIIILGAIVGIIYSLRRILLLEKRIKNIEIHTDKLVTKLVKRKK